MLWPCAYNVHLNNILVAVDFYLYYTFSSFNQLETLLIEYFIVFINYYIGIIYILNSIHVIRIIARVLNK